MSLLNDALRDLERREQPLPNESVRPVVPAQRRRWLTALPVVLLSLATLALAGWLIRDAGTSGDGAGQPVLAQPERSAPDAIRQADRPPTRPGGPAFDLESTGRAVSVASVSVASVAAEPESDRAAAPAAEARDAPASAPLRSAAAADSGAHDSGLIPESATEAVAEAIRTSAAEPAVGSIRETAASRPAPQARAEESIAAGSEEPPSTRPEASATRAEPAAAEPPAIIVRRAGGGSDVMRDRLDSARRALARGRPEVAIARLQELLEQQPAAGQARVLLARTLLETGRPGQAEEVLERGLAQGMAQGMAQEPGHAGNAQQLAFWLARMRMQRGAVQAAAEVLAAHRPSAPGHADYHLLEAAALRELGRHDQALAAYRLVAGAEPSNGRAWLGAGLSHEALEQSEAAASAYARAVAGDHPGSAAFAAQRLQALEYRGLQRDPSNPNR